jgi:NADH pyrophosphatase NudC (nudix superfamily)
VYTRCPGQDNRRLRVELHKCPSCGYEVEIFSDEIKVKCSHCGEHVFREETPSCIEWCASARQCLGEERWRKLMTERQERTIRRTGKKNKK